jgi:hypothetical protein
VNVALGVAFVSGGKPAAPVVSVTVGAAGVIVHVAVAAPEP